MNARIIRNMMTALLLCVAAIGHAAVSDISSLAGTYTAKGSTARAGILEWTMTITIEPGTNRVVFDNILPYLNNDDQLMPNEHNIFYGTLSSDRTKILIPYMSKYQDPTEGSVCLTAIVDGYVRNDQGNISISISNNGDQLILNDHIILCEDDGFPDGEVSYYNDVAAGCIYTKQEAGDVVVVTSGGQLADKIYGTEESLTIKGPLNGADLKVLRGMATTGNLKHLNFKNVNIVGGDPTIYFSTYSVTTDNQLPDYLFYESKLETIVLPSSITQIGNFAFGNSTELKEITIPAKVTKVASYSFERCRALANIFVEQGNTSFKSVEGVLYSYDGRSLVRYPMGKLATRFTVPSGTTTISECAFAGAPLVSVSLPSTLNKVDDYAFFNSKVETLALPAALSNIGESAFSGMFSLKSFSVASGNTHFSTDSCGVLYNYNKTLLHCYPIGNSRTSYTVPSSVTDLEFDAFWMSENLTQVTLPEGLKTIGGWAFSKSEKLVEVNIPSTVTLIDNNAFNNTKLKSVTLPAGLTSIGVYAFADCPELTRVTSLIQSPYAIDSSVFIDTDSHATLYVPQGTKSRYEALGGWSGFSGGIVEMATYPEYYYIVGEYNGWDTYTGTPLYSENADGVYQGFLYLSGDFKFVKYGTWIDNYGADVYCNLEAQGQNVNVVPGFYAVKLDIPTATCTFTPIDYIDLIGDCLEGYGYWNDDWGCPRMTYNIQEGCWETDVTFNSNGQEFKLRGNGTWSNDDGNWGGTLENVLNGSNDNLITPYTGKCHLRFYVSCNTKSYFVMSPVSNNPTAKGSGTLADPFNAIAANNKGQELAIGQSTSEEYYVKGKISYIRYPFSSDYGTATFCISDDGTRNNEFYVYATYYLGNKSWVEGDTQIAVGDEVVLYGKIMNYNGTPETSSKQCYIFSLNGSTNGSCVMEDGVITATLTTAGTLQSTIANSNFTMADIISLVVKGPINGDDIRYLRELAGVDFNGQATLGQMKVCNLLEANIVAGGSQYYSGCHTADNVVGDYMFANTSVEHVFLPVLATSVGHDVFTGCYNLRGMSYPLNLQAAPNGYVMKNISSTLSYIVWLTSNIKLNTYALPYGGTLNPNLLIYVQDASLTTNIQSVVKNIVVNNRITGDVVLSPDYNFFCPSDFTVSGTVSYTRNFTKTTGIGTAQGWETIALPFNVTKITHKTNGTLVPFSNWYGASDPNKPFWLYGYSTYGFKAVSGIEANTPYLIAMPNNSSYDADYNLNGEVTFSATGATVVTSNENWVGDNTRMFFPSFRNTLSVYDKYVINYNGSQFQNYTDMVPFSAYFMKAETTRARDFMDIFDLQPTGLDGIPTVGQDDDADIYDLQGRKVVKPVRGVYVRKGRKLIVR